MSARTVAAIPIAAVLVAFFTWSPPASIDRLLAALPSLARPTRRRLTLPPSNARHVAPWPPPVRHSTTARPRPATAESRPPHAPTADTAPPSCEPSPPLRWPTLDAGQLVAGRDGDPANDVGALAKRVGVSPRNLHRGIVRWIGMTPKALIRVERARRAARLVIAGWPPVEAAARLRFADQAHMIRELRALLGFSPRELTRSRSLSEFFKTLPP